MLRYITVLSLMAVRLSGQLPAPPAQPLTGPGGQDYLYPSYQKLGPYFVNPKDPEPYTAFYILEPSGGTRPASLPAALFLHGYLVPGEGYPLGDSPDTYLYWLAHLARMGYTVVFPAYDYRQPPRNFSANIIQSWHAALQLLASRRPGLIPPAADSRGIETVFAGHSMGAVQCFAVAQQLSVSPVDGVPLPRAIAAFSPGIGRSAISTDFSSISTTIRVVVAHGDQDTNNSATVAAIWNSLKRAVAAANRDLLLVNSDFHGSPAQVGNHFFPDTNGYGDAGSGVDDRDYNVTWKLSVGLFNCALHGADCSYGLGHGSADQVNMGSWSDGKPVTPLTLQP
jgi:hypothetical protein